MFDVQGVLISDDLLDAPFACSLGRCLGSCCTLPGGTGAPLEPEERALLEHVLPAVRHDLPRASREAIDAAGPWEEYEKGRFATRCVGNRDCVFVTYEGPVAKCAIHKAFRKGRLVWPKPISCHLFPIRIERYGGGDVLIYERIDACKAARIKGANSGVQLYDFLKEPLVRKYGEEWYEAFRTACKERRISLGIDSPQDLDSGI